MPWYPYEDVDHHFELPFKFRFETANADDPIKEIFKSISIPRVLPPNMFMAKTHQLFQYYHPAIAAPQLGFDQALIKVLFAELVKPRSPLLSVMGYDRLKHLSPSEESADTTSWRFVSFELASFKAWWLEWKNHLFCETSKTYCSILNPYYENNEQVKNFLPPSYIVLNTFSATNPLSLSRRYLSLLL